MTRIPPDAWRPKGITTLEDNAWTALRQTAHSIAVTAGAGAGKTEFLAQKAAYLLETGLCAPPQRILAICFKTDAALNLTRRVQARCPDVAARLDSLTFDAFTKGLLDRFRAAVPEPFAPPADYNIVFPRARDYDAFLRLQATDLNTRHLERLIARTALPLETSGLPAGRLRTLKAYWDQQFARDPVPLSFAMINRLVDWLLRENPHITEALRLTYPYVFLDEFQDTTVAQFGLIFSAFAGSEVVLTAVGDPKQRIMGWADAMPRSFDVFQSTFAATAVPLLLNWRSHASLVAVQRAIAGRIDPAAPDVEARAQLMVDGDVAAIWVFATRDAERQGLARWLRREVTSGKVAPEDIAILVRQHVDNVEAELAPALLAEGLVLRNLARMVGSVALQDLLGEELTEIVLALLRLATSDRAPEAWTQGLSMLAQIYAIAEHDERANQQLLDSVETFVSALGQQLAEVPPDDARASQALDDIIAFIGTDALRQAFPQYGREVDFERIRGGLRALLIECAEIEGTWPEALDRFEGCDQIPLMTVHKSKGLEFHTMIFFGLDNQSWWSLNAQNDEELNNLFVAFTRAEQRAFFTSCRQRGGAIVWIDGLLIPAGVKRVHGPS